MTAPLKKSMYSVMGHSGFSDLIIYNQGVKITVPQKVMRKGVVPSKLRALLLDPNLTFTSADQLYRKYGVTCERS